MDFILSFIKDAVLLIIKVTAPEIGRVPTTGVGRIAGRFSANQGSDDDAYPQGTPGEADEEWRESDRKNANNWKWEHALVKHLLARLKGRTAPRQRDGSDLKQ